MTTRLALLEDMYGIRHKADCHKRERTYKDNQGRWTCNGCGRRSRPTDTPPNRDRGPRHTNVA